MGQLGAGRSTDRHTSPYHFTADAARDYNQALAEADSYAQRGELLPLPSPTTHRIFRRWYLDGIVVQLHDAAQGQNPKPSEPFLVTQLNEVDNLLDNSR